MSEFAKAVQQNEAARKQLNDVVANHDLSEDWKKLNPDLFQKFSSQKEHHKYRNEVEELLKKELKMIFGELNGFYRGYNDNHCIEYSLELDLSQNNDIKSGLGTLMSRMFPDNTIFIHNTELEDYDKSDYGIEIIREN